MYTFTKNIHFLFTPAVLQLVDSALWLMAELEGGK